MEQSKKMMETSFKDKDFISRLPDEILTHILSSIPTKSSVSTSVLSKRWTRLWISVPTFDIDHDRAVFGCPVKKAHFLNFVDRFFNLKNALFVRKIKLQLYDCCEASRVASWINSIALRNAEEIDLSVYCSQDFHMPDKFFNQNNLVELKLAIYFSKIPRLVWLIPRSVWFPCLVTVHLGDVHLIDNGDGDDDSIKNLMLGCPVLKSLYLEIGKWDEEQTIYICSPTLHFLELDTEWCDNKVDNKVVMDAPNLEEIHLLNHYASYDIVNVSSSVKLYICFYGNDEIETSVLINLQQILHNVHHLTLEIIWREHWQRLPDLLHSTPNLVTLSLSVERDHAPCFWYEPDDVPSCFQSCFESVEIMSFRLNEGGEEETRLISYILKNATVLKKLFVHVDSTVEQEEGDRFLESLLTLPRTSIACEVYI